MPVTAVPSNHTNHRPACNILILTLYAVGFEPNPFYFYYALFIKAPFIQKILIPHPFLKMLSMTLLGITLKLHLQESRHNLMSTIYAYSIPTMVDNLARDFGYPLHFLVVCSGFFNEIGDLQINKTHFTDFNTHF